MRKRRWSFDLDRLGLGEEIGWVRKLWLDVSICIEIELENVFGS